MNVNKCFSLGGMAGMTLSILHCILAYFHITYWPLSLESYQRGSDNWMLSIDSLLTILLVASGIMWLIFFRMYQSSRNEDKGQ